MTSDPICLRVKGRFACFTRPEFHVERVSYPVITPSAARGILEAILMKPIEKPDARKRHNKVGFRWIITRLGIINKGTMYSILRNELGYSAHQKPEDAVGYDINAERIRAQRHSLILSGGTDANGNRRMLDYLIEAVIEVEDNLGPGGTRQPGPRWNTLQVLAKYHQMFLRRARVGQCFYQPFFGCREFSVAQWGLIDAYDGTDENGHRRWQLPGETAEAMQKVNEDFGTLFHDFDFAPVWKHWPLPEDRKAEPHPFAPRPPSDWDMPGTRPKPEHFTAHAVNGWIILPRRETRDY
jgi:CRISPR-associated protein Cas5d